MIKKLEEYDIAQIGGRWLVVQKAYEHNVTRDPDTREIVHEYTGKPFWTNYAEMVRESEAQHLLKVLQDNVVMRHNAMVDGANV